MAGEYFIALDTGGTKCDAVLFDGRGHILEHTRTTGGGPMDIGLKAAADNTVRVLKQLGEKIPDRKPAASIYCSIAGNDYYPGQLDACIRPQVEAGILKVWDDGECIITATLGRKDGGGMIAGTGASLFIRSGKVYKHIGGWGYLLDSTGSGYTMGQAALYAIVREADGRGEKTLLTEIIGKEMGRNPADNLPAVYAGGRTYIASFAHCVFEGRRLGDPVSCRIFDWTVDRLAEFTFAAVPYFESEFPVALNGGIFGAFPELAESLKEKAAPQARLIPAEVPPVYGAATEALWNLGIPETEYFKQTFMKEYG